MSTSPPSPADVLRRTLEGRFDRWQWVPGLTPDAVGLELGAHLSPEWGRLGGRDLLQAVLTVPPQPHAVQFRWEADGELALAELSHPRAVPSWPEVIDALGSPDVIYPHGQGPFPGSEQRCHFGRGLTVFDGAGLGYQGVWLYPPMTEAEYGALTGAFEMPTRTR